MHLQEGANGKYPDSMDWWNKENRDKQGKHCHKQGKHLSPFFLLSGWYSREGGPSSYSQILVDSWHKTQGNHFTSAWLGQRPYFNPDCKVLLPHDPQISSPSPLQDQELDWDPVSGLSLAQ